ncbi:DMT family transporter [Ktedonosporobacter rubrisoli]|uniref:DMT family transporter n=1 Tax=Ktedonosporobacter rubrisoli TaxID=2509675 RepID=A0A4P6JMN2_KTERU|nr:DMT family transporter [Ktedonosporobacter rubrisoli]QBD76320.1 DMT family transporter [Ktedonosporobacter rubrisoli]
MSSRSSKSVALPWSFLILANALWATGFAASKFALEGLSVTMMLVLRLGLAAIFLLPILIFQLRTARLTRRDIPQLAQMTLTGFFINKLLEFGGLALSTAADVALLITAETIFTSALAWLLLHEPFKKSTLLALLLGLIGVYLVVGQGLIPVLPAGGGLNRIIGDLLVILSLVFEAFTTVRGKTLLTKHSPYLITSAAIVGSTVFWIPIAGWEVWHTGWPHMNGNIWLSVLWLAIMTTFAAYLLWFQGLSKLGGVLASSTLLVQPLLGTLLAVLLLHEHLTLFTIIGGILIVISVSLLMKFE